MTINVFNFNYRRRVLIFAYFIIIRGNTSRGIWEDMKLRFKAASLLMKNVKIYHPSVIANLIVSKMLAKSFILINLFSSSKSSYSLRDSFLLVKAWNISSISVNSSIWARKRKIYVFFHSCFCLFILRTQFWPNYKFFYLL